MKSKLPLIIFILSLHNIQNVSATPNCPKLSQILKIQTEVNTDGLETYLAPEASYHLTRRCTPNPTSLDNLGSQFPKNSSIQKINNNKLVLKLPIKGMQHLILISEQANNQKTIDTISWSNSNPEPSNVISILKHF